MKPLATVRTPDGQVLHLKTCLEEQKKISVFYTGGPLVAANTSTVFFCACDTNVSIIDADTGRVIRELAGDTEPVMSFAVSPDDSILVVASRSRQVRVFDWNTGICIRSFKAHDGPIVCMDFDKTGTLLATGSADATVKVWDIKKGYCTHNFTGSGGVVSSVSFHPERLELFSCSTDCHIRWWSLETSKPLGVLQGHNSLVRGIGFARSGDTELVVSGGRDSVVLIWDLASQSIVSTVPVYETVEALVMLPLSEQFEGKRNKVVARGGFYFVIAGDKGALRVLEYPSGKTVHESPCPSKLVGCFWDKRSNQLVSTTFDNTLLLHDISTFQRTKQFVGSYDEVIDVKFIGEEQTHVAVATNIEHIQVIEIETLDSNLLQGHTDIVMCLDVANDGLTLVSGAKDNTIRVWQADAEGVWDCVAVGSGHAADVTTVTLTAAATADPTKIYHILSGSRDCTLKLWTFATTGASLETVYTRKAHEKDINDAAFAPNGKIAITAGQDRLAKVWKVATGEAIGTLKGHRRGIWQACFSPIDQVAATASADATIKLWALADFTCIKTFEGHDSSVLGVRFLCRGVQLLSAGADGLLKLWNIRTTELVRTMDAHEGRVWALAVTRDEATVVSGSQDGSIVVWKDATLQEDAALRAEEDTKVVRIQELSNLIAHEDYAAAAQLALELSHPFSLLRVLKKLLQRDAGELQRLLVELSSAKLSELLGYLQDWNSNSRHCLVAQRVLGAVLRHVRPARLLEVPRIDTLVPALTAYSERHFRRLATLQQRVRLLDYTWAEMRISDVGQSSAFAATAVAPETPAHGDAPTARDDACAEHVADDTNTVKEAGDGKTEEHQPKRRRVQDAADENDGDATALRPDVADANTGSSTGDHASEPEAAAQLPSTAYRKVTTIEGARDVILLPGRRITLEGSRGNLGQMLLLHEHAALSSERIRIKKTMLKTLLGNDTFERLVQTEQLVVEAPTANRGLSEPQTGDMVDNSTAKDDEGIADASEAVETPPKRKRTPRVRKAKSRN